MTDQKGLRPTRAGVDWQHCPRRPMMAATAWVGAGVADPETIMRAARRSCPMRPRCVEAAMTRVGLRLWACALTLLAAAPGWAGDPVAMVEDVSGAPAGIQPMDYLAAAQVIHLGPKGRVIVDY